MTTQIHDTVVDSGQDYLLVAVEGVALFEPQSVGLEVAPLGTWCWRGFVAEYSLDAGRLVLVGVIVSGRAARNGRQLAVGDTALGGEVVPSMHILVRRGGGLKIACSIPIAETGRLLIARDVIWGGQRRNMGFAPPWQFETVVEIELREGIVAARTDRSLEIEHVRAEIDGGRRPDPDGAPGGEDWVARTFTRDFARSGLS